MSQCSDTETESVSSVHVLFVRIQSQATLQSKRTRKIQSSWATICGVTTVTVEEENNWATHVYGTFIEIMKKLSPKQRQYFTVYEEY